MKWPIETATLAGVTDPHPILKPPTRAELQEKRQRLVFSYSVAAAVVGIVLIMRLSLSVAVAGSSAFLLFMGAVMMAAWVGGTGPGLFATVLSALVGNYFFMEPKLSFGLGTNSEEVEFVLFLVEGAIITILAGQLHRARETAVRRQEEARELEKRMLEISDGEQRRIGHDLHDGLGQHLTGIALLTRRLGQRLSNAASPEAPEAVQIAELAKSAVEWTHDLCKSLSPPVLEREGLAPALRELAHHAENLFKIRCNVMEDGVAPAQDINANVHLYRIAQEAISNAVKHGKATEVIVSLQHSDRDLRMEIADNGGGLQNPAKERDATAHSGMGLRIMHYRARLIGADLELRSVRGRPSGLAVVCTYSGNNQPNQPVTNPISSN